MTQDTAAQLALLADAEKNLEQADLELQIAREQFVEYGLVVPDEYEAAWLRYIELAMMVDMSRHLHLNAERGADSGGS